MVLSWRGKKGREGKEEKGELELEERTAGESSSRRMQFDVQSAVVGEMI